MRENTIALRIDDNVRRTGSRWSVDVVVGACGADGVAFGGVVGWLPIVSGLGICTRLTCNDSSSVHHQPLSVYF